MTPKKQLLILCTGNSCRSQMAEGIVRHLFSDQIEVFSAGSHPATSVNPRAIEAMQEIGIDISAHTPKHVDLFRNQAFDWVITVCDNAKESCPVFLNTKESMHWSFPDPYEATGTPEEIRDVFRKSRDAIYTTFQKGLQTRL